MHSKVKMVFYPKQNNVASAIHCIMKECKKWKPSIARIAEESKEQGEHYLPGRQLTRLEAHSKKLKIDLFLALGMHGSPSKWEDSIVRFFSGAFRAVGEVCHQLGSIKEALTYIGASFELKQGPVVFSARQVANNLLRLVIMHHELGQFDMAHLAFTEAIPYLRHAHGDDHPVTVKAMQALANVRRATEWKPFQGRSCTLFKLLLDRT